LSDLIPSDHTDFHSHLLFGIDDGAKTPEDSLSLVRDLTKMGCARFIVTPHIMHSIWDNSSETIVARLKQTQDFLSANGVNVPMRAAAEYLIDSFFLQRIKSEKLLTIHENYVLVEMSYLNPPIQLFDILFELQLEGYVPVLAHPERYGFYHNRFSDYEKLKDAGCLMQVNLLSCVGYYGKSVALAAEKLLNAGLIDFAGSDVHHARHIAAFSTRLAIDSEKPLTQALENNKKFRF